MENELELAGRKSRGALVRLTYFAGADIYGLTGHALAAPRIITGRVILLSI